jgi:hypothetical protein
VLAAAGLAAVLVAVASADTISADGDILAGTNNVAYGSGAFQNACATRGTPVGGNVTIKFNGTVHYDPGTTVTVSVTPDASAAGAGITATGGSASVPVVWDSKPEFFTVPITTTVPSTVPDGAYTVNVEAVGAAHDAQGHAVQLAADDSYAVSVTCTGGSFAPVINWNAHPPQSNGGGDTKTYTFGIKDDDSSSWSFASGYPDCGANGTLSNATIDNAGKKGSFDCTFSGSSGSSNVRVKITDGTSNSNELTQRVQIGAAGNAPPVVDAGPPASGAEGSAIPLTGSVSDPDNTPTSSWSYAPFSGVDPGAGCSFADASSPATTITCTDDGVYTATLTADDGVNPPQQDSTTVTVSNATPMVTINSPTAGSHYSSSPVSASASFTDAGHNDTHTCTIDWGDASPVDTGTVTESNGSGTCAGSHTYTTGGSHTITVSVADDDGATGQDMVTVTNDAPIVDAGPAPSGAEGSAIPLSGSVTDPDSTPTSSWSYTPGAGVDAGATCSFADASSPATTITCTDDGSYTATLTANDGLNAPQSSSTTVTVSNATPVVTITSPTAGQSFLPGQTVSVSASFTDAGTNDTHTCSIDWGDGTPATAGTVTESNGSGTCTGSHTYAMSAFGSRTITVSVTDDDGATGQDTVGITVSSAKALKQDALARTNALIPGASKPDQDKLKAAANEITLSLAPTRWGADDNHVSETKGQEVFDHEKNAMAKLVDLHHGTTIPDSSLQPIIDDLLNADQIIAQTEINDAVAAHGDATKISQANVELSKAATERANGHYSEAIDHYKHAWEHARDAF